MDNAIDALQNSVVRLLVSPEEIERFEHYDALRNWLVENIAWLLDHDFERLLCILYRIDVSEEKVRNLIAKNEEKGCFWDNCRFNIRTAGSKN